MFINDSLVRDEFTWSLRHAVCFEISARPDHERSALSDLARRESRVGKIAEAQCHIYPRFYGVNVTVIKNNVDVERGMLGQENRQTGYDVQSREGHGCGDA